MIEAIVGIIATALFVYFLIVTRRPRRAKSATDSKKPSSAGKVNLKTTGGKAYRVSWMRSGFPDFFIYVDSELRSVVFLPVHEETLRVYIGHKSKAHTWQEYDLFGNMLSESELRPGLVEWDIQAKKVVLYQEFAPRDQRSSMGVIVSRQDFRQKITAEWVERAKSVHLEQMRNPRNGIPSTAQAHETMHEEEGLYSGGDGSTLENAVVVNAATEQKGVPAEYNYISAKHGQRGRNWQLHSRSVEEKNGKHYEIMDIITSEGEHRPYCFDITEFYGNIAKPKKQKKHESQTTPRHVGQAMWKVFREKAQEKWQEIVQQLGRDKLSELPGGEEHLRREVLSLVVYAVRHCGMTLVNNYEAIDKSLLNSIQAFLCDFYGPEKGIQEYRLLLEAQVEYMEAFNATVAEGDSESLSDFAIWVGRRMCGTEEVDIRFCVFLTSCYAEVYDATMSALTGTEGISKERAYASVRAGGGTTQKSYESGAGQKNSAEEATSQSSGRTDSMVCEQAKDLQEDSAEKLGVSVEREIDLGHGLKLKVRLIPSGEFMMGSALSPEEVTNRYGGTKEYFTDEHPRHPVRLTKSFYMGVKQVTQQQYETIMGENPSEFEGSLNPVDTVRWIDCLEFCDKLSEMTGNDVRSPTEAEWEYACRAGSSSVYCFGDSQNQLGRYAWYADNSNNTTHPVGQKQPNNWGLYDMHGNVWEWCWDWYKEDFYEDRIMIDPTGPPGSKRVLRGGSWDYYASHIRSAARHKSDPMLALMINSGFRVVMFLPEFLTT